MTGRPSLAPAAALLMCCVSAPAAVPDRAEERGFSPLFSGNDLSQWVPVNLPPTTFTIEDGVVSGTGFPMGVMRTRRQYENYVLELEWRHLTPDGNAGLFLHADAAPGPGQTFPRALEVQIILGHDPEGNWTQHGDVFPINGMKFVPDRPHPGTWKDRCLPSEWRVKGVGEWNHYRVESRDGRVTLAVNGKAVSGGSGVVPRKGYIALESEGAPWQIRNMRIRELPSSHPQAHEVAQAAPP